MILTTTQELKVKWLEANCKFIRSLQQFIETAEQSLSNDQARAEFYEWAWALSMK